MGKSWLLGKTTISGLIHWTRQISIMPQENHMKIQQLEHAVFDLAEDSVLNRTRPWEPEGLGIVFLA